MWGERGSGAGLGTKGTCFPPSGEESRWDGVEMMEWNSRLNCFNLRPWRPQVSSLGASEQRGGRLFHGGTQRWGWRAHGGLEGLSAAGLLGPPPTCVPAAGVSVPDS